MADPSPQSTEAPKPPPTFRRCRSLTVLGKPCNQRALIGEELCVAHARNRFPVCPQGDKIAVPLLEDLPTIRVVATQVAHGLFTQTLDPWRAGKILYALQVAASTLPRTKPVEPTSAQLSQELLVAETSTAPDGQILGPAANWIGPKASFEPIWRFDKYLYEKECESLGKPLPQCPSDMPPSGWLPEEVATPSDPLGGSPPEPSLKDKILDVRIEADRQGKLPPLQDRKCSYNPGFQCGGPASKFVPCERCKRERDAHLALSASDDKPQAGIDLNAAAEAATRLSTRYIEPTLIPATKTCRCPVPGGGVGHHTRGSRLCQAAPSDETRTELGSIAGSLTRRL